MKKTTAAALCTVFTGCSVAHKSMGETSQKFPASEISSLNLKNGAGEIVVHGIADSKSTLTVDRKNWSTNCKLNVDHPAGGLNVSISEQGRFLVIGCEADMTANVPVNTSTTIESGSGNTHIDGLDSPINIYSGSGSIDISYSTIADARELKVKSGSGNTTLHVPAGAHISFDLKTGSGKIQNDFASENDAPFKVTIETGSGAITVTK